MAQTLADMIGGPGEIIDRLLHHRTKMRDERGSMSGPTKCLCEECGEFSDLYMLTDEVWAVVHPSGSRGFLCLHCVVERLGRPLEMADFRPVLANLPIAVGYEIGRRR